MTQIGESERKTQNRLVRLFRDKLNYKYLGSWQDRANNKNIEEELLCPYLSERGYSQSEISRALQLLRAAAFCDYESHLYAPNKAVYSLLRYGVNVPAESGEGKRNVHLIDWNNPLANDFYLAEEVTVTGKHTKRPDLVVYVNGIALAVIELKRSTVSVEEGIRQNLDNQSTNFIKPFFTTVQLICAGNDSQGLHYGVIKTPEKFWLRWKEEDSSVSNELDRST